MRHLLVVMTLLSTWMVAAECDGDEQPALDRVVERDALPVTQGRLFTSIDSLGLSVITNATEPAAPAVESFGNHLETMQPEWDRPRIRSARHLSSGYVVPPRSKYSRWILVR